MRGYRIVDLPKLIMMQPKTVVQVYMYIFFGAEYTGMPVFL